MGRREQASTSIYVALDGPLDQYFFSNPAHLFGRPIDAMVGGAAIHALPNPCQRLKRSMDSAPAGPSC